MAVYDTLKDNVNESDYVDELAKETFLKRGSNNN